MIIEPFCVPLVLQAYVDNFTVYILSINAISRSKRTVGLPILSFYEISILFLLILRFRQVQCLCQNPTHPYPQLPSVEASTNL